MAADLFRDTRGILIESIWWDARTDEVVWVDITAGTIHRGRWDGAVDGSDDRVIELPPPVSAVQPATGGGYVAALKDRVVLLDAAGGITRDLAALPHRHDGIRLNEGKVDPFGRFVVGAMDLSADDPDAGLYAVGADGFPRTLLGGFGITNGLEWNDDGSVMFVTDTMTRTVYRGAYGPDGDLGELEPFLVGRMSDGLVRAADGSFFNGIYGDGVVVHWGADGGVLGERTIPVPNVTSVAFAGPALDVLLVGTARENLSEDALSQHPLSGGIFRLDTGATGLPVHTFGEDHSASDDDLHDSKEN
ncbi:SMP-30/gluconolactonase/LRE family protein [Microbacterium sp. ARD31]|uniref:SMP-30/gluconolactonase/LRE family protein n=1 Tax=Microbacterium sp. ARD31 TaxID=2962576 RepID=UPI0028813F06|nr:SMP-30/gluconolactonase/LRE family protein [Microbacterium sp. ARD31]MDT0180388.1 SMP-30/gluconolactonase/LRE family protein [Microbacterium sp. ARD31]